MKTIKQIVVNDQKKRTSNELMMKKLEFNTEQIMLYIFCLR